MKLYTFPGAPSPMRVRLYIAEKNAAAKVLDVEEVQLQGGQLSQAAHLRRNPFGKVPEPGVADHYLGRRPVGLGFLERRLEGGSRFIAGQQVRAVF